MPAQRRQPICKGGELGALRAGHRLLHHRRRHEVSRWVRRGLLGRFERLGVLLVEPLLLGGQEGLAARLRRPHGFLTRADQKAAAFIAGSSKPAFVADVELAGRISATRTEAGAIEVEPVELFRVFPPLAMQRAPQEAMHPLATADATAESALRVNALEVKHAFVADVELAGRISATRTEAGAIEVEPVELFRVFPPLAIATAESALGVNALEVEVKMLREMLDAMRDDRNAWRDQAGKVVAALPRPAASERRPWWRRLVS